MCCLILGERHYYVLRHGSRLLRTNIGIRNFYVADPEGNLLEIGSMNEA